MSVCSGENDLQQTVVNRIDNFTSIYVIALHIIKLHCLFYAQIAQFKYLIKYYIALIIDDRHAGTKPNKIIEAAM